MGVELAYPVKDVFVIRLNVTCLIDFYRTGGLTWKGLTIQRAARPVLYPSMSLIGRSPLFHAIRVYGGITAGIAYVNVSRGVMISGGTRFYL